jgi:hypothetical protein
MKKYRQKLIPDSAKVKVNHKNRMSILEGFGVQRLDSPDHVKPTPIGSFVCSHTSNMSTISHEPHH